MTGNERNSDPPWYPDFFFSPSTTDALPLLAFADTDFPPADCPSVLVAPLAAMSLYCCCEAGSRVFQEAAASPMVLPWPFIMAPTYTEEAGGTGEGWGGWGRGRVGERRWRREGWMDEVTLSKVKPSG